MRMDFHTHAFPDALAPRAVAALSHTGGALVPCTDGTAAGLVTLMDACGVHSSVVLSVATKPSQQLSILKWCQSIQSERLIPFASIHPDAPDAMEMLEEIARAGLKGVKLHPQYQGFEAGREKYFPLYRKIARLGLICTFHAGMDIGYPPPCLCTPKSLTRALTAFDGAPVIAAHFGGYMLWEEALSVYPGTGIYIDTSFSHGRIIVPLAQRLIEKLGCDHVLFGSDAPWSSPAPEAALIESLALTQAEKRAILYENAGRLLRLKQQ